jgi:hypothetical protein
MKVRDKILITACACVIAFTALYATTTNIKDNEAGYQLGTTSSQAVGFLGATPSSQLATGTSPYSALQTFGFIASGGNDYTVQHATISLSAAQINGMAAAPVQLVAAAGAGKTIVVTRTALRITRTATAFASGGVGIVQYGNTATGAGTQALDSTFSAATFTGASGASESVRNGAVLSDQGTALQNLGLFISNQTAAFTTGTGTATVDVWYYTF